MRKIGEQDILKVILGIEDRQKKIIKSYKLQILGLLYLKYISDNCSNIPEQASFQYIYTNKDTKSIIQMINEALYLNSILEDSNRNNEEVAEGGEVEEIFKQIIVGIETYSINLVKDNLARPSVLADVFSYLFNEFSITKDKRKDGFYTPRELNYLIARLIGNQNLHTLYDPTCGTGETLIDVAKNNPNVKIYGQEHDIEVQAICRMNMVTNGISNASISLGDSITMPKQVENDTLMTFDAVISHPPLLVEEWAIGCAQKDKYGRFKYGIPPKYKGDFAYIQHVLSCLKNNAIAVMVLPHGILFRGSSEQQIREKIIKDNLIDAIIGLPENLLYGREIPICIVIFKKNRAEKDILFIDASRETEKTKVRNVLTHQSIEKILETYTERKEYPHYSRNVSIGEIEANEFNLNISRYIETESRESEIDIRYITKQMIEIEEELANIRKEMAHIMA